MNNREAKALLDKYLSGNCSPEEKAIVERAYNKASAQVDPLISEERLSDMKAEMWNHLQAQKKPQKILALTLRIAAAASLLLFISIGGYFYLQDKHNQQIAQQVNQKILPGSDKAILTLASGRQINLAGAKNGVLANEGITKINKSRDGQIIYDHNSTSGNATIFNSVTTPRGGQYHLTLSDGTDVWLNAASSIRYPAAFAKSQRDVEITGEAYFEVAHDADRPFRVRSKDQTVEVLGTHFNVNAYDDERKIITTLLQGSVRVFKNGNASFKQLLPGQQSVYATDQISVSVADPEQSVAWKNGEFQFDGNIRSIMRQVARWYDIDVNYKANVPDHEFVAVIPRTSSISDVLKALELTGKVHFKIEGRSVMVMP